MSKLIVNCKTGEETTRELNKVEKDQEILDLKKSSDLDIEIAAITDAAATQKAALLARLGITADEAKLLIG